MPEIFTLARDGQRPLRFTGTLLAKRDGCRQDGRDQSRYYTLSLYHTADDAVLAHIEYATRWQGEAHHSVVYQCADAEEAIAKLERFDPLEWVVGFKPQINHSPASTQHYTPRQEALERSIHERYNAQFAEIALALNIVEEL